MVTTTIKLPGLDCGLCGYRTCEEFRGHLASTPESIRRCIHLSEDSIRMGGSATKADGPHLPFMKQDAALSAKSCPSSCSGCSPATAHRKSQGEQATWRDSLDREFDFYLEHFPEDPGPREIIIPHNPMITREMEVKVGDILIGRPLGMSCGCPITHCGVATSVDMRTGVIVWSVTGPLGPRAHGFKDLGYYIAEGYEGMVKDTRAELKVGMRYYFQPRMCMLQWRHSGLLNYLNRVGDQYQVRLEGLWIG